MTEPNWRTFSGWCLELWRPNCAGCRDDTCGCPEPICVAKRQRLTGISGQMRDNGASTKDGPGDSLRQQRAEVPGPRPTLDRSAEL